MKTRSALACLACLCSFAHPANLAAQDLVISNARILVGNGSVIESGTVIVRSGRIASIGAGTAAQQARGRSTRAA
jgi:imidazolonepropionase-like amidohydrolase